MDDKRYTSVRGVVDDVLLARAEEAEAEVARLQEQIKSAYEEGARDGGETTHWNQPHQGEANWEDSDSKKALEDK